MRESGVLTQMTRHQNFDATPGMDWTIFSIGCHVEFDTLCQNFYARIKNSDAALPVGGFQQFENLLPNKFAFLCPFFQVCFFGHRDWIYFYSPGRDHLVKHTALHHTQEEGCPRPR